MSECLQRNTFLGNLKYDLLAVVRFHTIAKCFSHAWRVHTCIMDDGKYVLNFSCILTQCFAYKTVYYVITQSSAILRNVWTISLDLPKYILPASVMYIITVYQNFSTFITAISACILVCKCVDYTMYVDMFKLAIKKKYKTKTKNSKWHKKK